MRPSRDQVMHFSQDPCITEFEPHVAATAQQPEAYVWAVDAQHAPSYWFPRQCPRAMAWVVDGTTTAHRDRILGPPEPVGDLLELHARAGIQLRVLPELWTFWDAVTTTTLGWSGIRLRNALPRPS